MRIPRDLAGAELARALGVLGYRITHFETNRDELLERLFWERP
jgi:hypothetical protein